MTSSGISNVITLTRIVSGTKTSVPPDLVEAGRPVPTGVGNAFVHLQVTVPALEPRDAEAAVATSSAQAHGPIVARAGSTRVLIQLAEPSSISRRAEAPRVHRVLAANPPVLAGAGAAGTEGGGAGRPSVPRRTVTPEAPFSWGGHTRGVSSTGVGGARVRRVVTVSV